jgi:hypothetical protein
LAVLTATSPYGAVHNARRQAAAVNISAISPAADQIGDLHGGTGAGKIGEPAKEAKKRTAPVENNWVAAAPMAFCSSCY